MGPYRDESPDRPARGRGKGKGAALEDMFAQMSLRRPSDSVIGSDGLRITRRRKNSPVACNLSAALRRGASGLTAYRRNLQLQAAEARAAGQIEPEGAEAPAEETPLQRQRRLCAEAAERRKGGAKKTKRRQHRQ
jgi:hypothetical protein